LNKKWSTLGVAPNSELGPSLTIFLPHPSFYWHREKLKWGKKRKPNLGLAPNWDPSPSLAFFLFVPSKLLLVLIEAKMEPKNLSLGQLPIQAPSKLFFFLFVPSFFLFF